MRVFRVVEIKIHLVPAIKQCVARPGIRVFKVIELSEINIVRGLLNTAKRPIARVMRLKVIHSRSVT